MVKELPHTDGDDACGAPGDAATMVRRLRHRARTASPSTSRSILQRAQDGLAAMRLWSSCVVDQTRGRVYGGDTHVPGKVGSRKRHTACRHRKGKISKPNQFGNLVTIQEAEQHQIVTAFEIHTGRLADS